MCSGRGKRLYSRGHSCSGRPNGFHCEEGQRHSDDCKVDNRVNYARMSNERRAGTLERDTKDRVLVRMAAREDSFKGKCHVCFFTHKGTRSGFAGESSPSQSVRHVLVPKIDMVFECLGMGGVRTPRELPGIGPLALVYYCQLNLWEKYKEDDSSALPRMKLLRNIRTGEGFAKQIWPSEEVLIASASRYVCDQLDNMAAKMEAARSHEGMRNYVVSGLEQIWRRSGVDVRCTLNSRHPPILVFRFQSYQVMLDAMITRANEMTGLLASTRANLTRKEARSVKKKAAKLRKRAELDVRQDKMDQDLRISAQEIAIARGHAG